MSHTRFSSVQHARRGLGGAQYPVSMAVFNSNLSASDQRERAERLGRLRAAHHGRSRGKVASRYPDRREQPSAAVTIYTGDRHAVAWQGNEGRRDDDQTLWHFRLTTNLRY